jgi:Ca-activated chloride channel family protein
VKKLEPLFWSLGFLLLASLFYLPTWLSDGSMLFFDSPWFLLGLLAVPVIIASSIMEKKNTGRIRFPLLSVLKAEGTGWKTRLIPISVGIKCAAVALLSVAMARPMDRAIREETETQGIDIVLTLDVSMSMKTGDLEPSRHEAAKAVVLDFIQRRKNDRIGAVIFAENAYTLCPLTLDYSILANMIREIKLGVIAGNATAIGDAISRSINRLRKSDAKTKTIILLTDGASNAGSISPEQASLFAQTLGIKIYTIMMGKDDMGKVATGLDMFGQAIFGQQSAPINRELLVKMSEDTGGKYFEAGDRKGLESSFHAVLDALEKSRIEDMDVKPAEVFAMYLWPALILLFLDLFLGLIVLRRTP